jgi:hypothetical protein
MGARNSTTENVLATVPRLRSALFDQVFASQDVGVANPRDQDSLAKAFRIRQARRNLPVSYKDDMSVKPAASFQNRHAEGRQAKSTLEFGNALSDRGNDFARRAFVGRYPPKCAAPLLTVERHEVDCAAASFHLSTVHPMNGRRALQRPACRAWEGRAARAFMFSSINYRRGQT